VNSVPTVPDSVDGVGECECASGNDGAISNHSKGLFRSALCVIWPRGIETLRRAEVDKAVVFAVAAPVLRIVSGPVSALLMIRFFTPEIQGFYFTFGSLAALQVLLELGLAARG
jgi:hypothetical protein